MVEEPGHLGFTRSFETTQGALTYPELSERLAVAPRHDRLTNSPVSASMARRFRDEPS